MIAHLTMLLDSTLDTHSRRNNMDFTFAALNLSITDQDRNMMLSEVLSADESSWHLNEFRGCKMLPVYNSGGQLGGQSTTKSNFDIFDFTEPAQSWLHTQKILKEKIFPWLLPEGRVTILKTPAGHGLNVHLDSTEDEIGSLQHKFRIVLNGNIDKLYFIDAHNNKVNVPDNYNTYVLDGSHPHALDPGTQEKITLCIGAPWKGHPNPAYNKIIEKAPFKMTVSRPTTLENAWTDPFWKR